MALSNLVMVGVMTMAPVQMHHHGASLTAIGIVVSAHIAAMFAPAAVSGWLTARLGAATTGLVAATVLVVACLSASWFAAGPFLGVAMVVLGLGWNLGLVSGSVLLTSGLSATQRPQREGLGEIGMGAAAVVGGLGASLLSGTAGYPVLALAGAASSVLLAAILVGYRITVPQPAMPRRAADPSHSTAAPTAPAVVNR